MTNHPSPGIYNLLVDKSQFNPDALTAGHSALFHIFSDRGEDNKILRMPTDLNALKEYGEPNYAKYGLSHHAAMEWLQGGLGAFMCRLMPSDAEYSHLTFSARTKKHLQNLIISPYTGNYNGTATTGEVVYEKTAKAFFQAISSSPIETSFNQSESTWTEVPVFSDLSVYNSDDLVQNKEKTKLYKSKEGSDAGAFNSADWELIGDVTIATTEYREVIHDPYIGEWSGFAIANKYVSYEKRFYFTQVNIDEEKVFNEEGTTWTLVDTFNDDIGYEANSVATDLTGKILYKANKKLDPAEFNSADWTVIGEIVETDVYKPLLIDPYVGIYGGEAVKDKVVLHKDTFFVAKKFIASENKFNEDGLTWEKVLKYKASKTYTVDSLCTDVAGTTLYKCNTEIKKPEPFDVSKWTVIGEKVTGSNVIDVFNDTLTDYNYNTDAIIGEKPVPQTGDLPFLSLYPVGRGESYNKLSVIIEEDNSFKDTFDFRVYRMSIYDIDDKGFTINLESDIVFSLYEDAVDLSGESLFLPQVLEDYDSILRAVTNFDDDNIIKLITMLEGKVGLNITPETLFNYNIIEDILDKEIRFAGGSDGSLLSGSFSRLDAGIKSSLVNEFYSGTIDEKILNHKEIDASFVFDVDLVLNNKFDLSDFTAYTRNDIFAYFSDSFEKTNESLLDFRQDEFNVDNRFSSLKAGSGLFFDDYSGKYIKVPFLLTKIRNFAYATGTQGVHIPKAGYNNLGLVTGIKLKSVPFSPTKGYEDLFYLNQINYPVKEPDGLYFLSTRTLQKYNSSLSNESVVQSVQQMQRETNIMGKRFLIKLITDQLIDDIESDYRNYFSKWIVNGTLEYANVYAVANRIDRKNNRVRVFFEIRFNGILKFRACIKRLLQCTF